MTIHVDIRQAQEAKILRIRKFFEYQETSELFEYVMVVQKELAKSSTAVPVYGYIDYDEYKRGQYVINVCNSLRDRFSGSGRRISDAQSGWIDESPAAKVSDAEPWIVIVPSALT